MEISAGETISLSAEVIGEVLGESWSNVSVGSETWSEIGVGSETWTETSSEDQTWSIQ